MMLASSHLGGGDDGNLEVDLGRLIPIGDGGADCLADGLGDGELAGQGIDLGGDGGAVDSVAAAAKGLALDDGVSQRC